MAIAIVDPPNLPEITIGVDLERMTNTAIGVLANDERVFQRGGELVHVLRVPTTSPRERVRREPGTPTIRAMTAPLLRERLASGARWIAFRKKKGGEIAATPALPPDHVVHGLVARGEWGGVRPLTCVVTAPMLLPSGEVLQTPGYDKSSALLYWPSARFLPVPPAPSRDDAMRAKERVLEVVCDFPFARPEHRSAWLAGVFTMLARNAVDGCVPLFAADANTRGTGKSRIVDAAVRLVHGQDAARMSQPEDDDEMRKRITTLVREGDPAVLLDNVSRSLQYASLDALLTSSTWKDRVLGSNDSTTSPNVGVWWASGNNLDFGGDLARRTLHLRLESPLENPEERDGFTHPDLIAWVTSERHRLVPAALTCLRAFVVAGAPRSGVKSWGSFESWSKVVASAVAWLDEPDPMLARASAADVLDHDKQQLKLVIEGIDKLVPAGRALTVRAILDALYPHGDPRDRAPDGFDALRDALEGAARAPRPGHPPDARRVGLYLRKHRGRVLSGKKLENGEQFDGVATWRVV